MPQPVEAAKIEELARKINPHLHQWAAEYGAAFAGDVLVGAAVHLLDKANGPRATVGFLRALADGLEKGVH